MISLAYSPDIPLFIGTDSKQANFYSGSLDDIALWNKVFVPQKTRQMVWEIPALHQVEQGLVAHWGFNQEVGNSVMDTTLLHNATIHGEVNWVTDTTKPLVTSNACL